jgi:hypothetical protein
MLCSSMMKDSQKAVRKCRWHKTNPDVAASNVLVVDYLREVDRALSPRSLDPIDSISRLLSITVGRNTLAEGISLLY